MTSRKIGFAVSHVSVKFKGNWTILFNPHCCRLQSETLWSSSELIFLLSEHSFAAVRSRETLAQSRKWWKWCRWGLDCSHVWAGPELRCLQVQEAPMPPEKVLKLLLLGRCLPLMATLLLCWLTGTLSGFTVTLESWSSLSVKLESFSHDTSQNYTQPILTVKPKNTISKIGNGSPHPEGHIRSTWDDFLFLTCCYVSPALKLIL